jgi:hypothetical protein
VARHATFRSVWFLDSLRGALAVATAVAVADLADVQHGFWVVLGTLSVLRGNAAATGATAWRALAVPCRALPCRLYHLLPRGEFGYIRYAQRRYELSHERVPMMAKTFFIVKDLCTYRMKNLR